MLSNDQRAMLVLLATTHMQHWRNEGSAFLDHMITVNESYMHSFGCQLKWQNAEWHTQMSLRNRIARLCLCSPKVMQFMFFSQTGLVHDHPMPVGTAVSGNFYCIRLQYKVRLGFCRKKPDLLENCVIFLQDIATPPCHHDVQNLVQQWGWEMLAYPSYSPNLTPCDYWLRARAKECVWGN